MLVLKKKQKIHGLLLKDLGTGLSHKGLWDRENLDFSCQAFNLHSVIFT